MGMTARPPLEHIPCYSPKEAARLVGVSPRWLGQWARYERVDSYSIGDGRAYSWMDLAGAIAGRLRLHKSGLQPEGTQLGHSGKKCPMCAKTPPLPPLPPCYLEIGAHYLSEGGWARLALGEDIYRGGVSVRPEVMGGKLWQTRPLPPRAGRPNPPPAPRLPDGRRAPVRNTG